jgi:hypothetical protein
MPTVKTNTRNQTEMSRSRLRILDELLSRGGHIPSREELTRRVNQHLMYSVSQSTVDKDLGKLRELVRNSGVGVDILRRDGYRYSRKGYSYFQDQVTEREWRAFELLSQAFGSRLGEECILLMQELSRKLHKICPCVSGGQSTEAAAKGLECSASDVRRTPFLLEAWSYVQRPTPARVKMRGRRNDDWRHISPCLVYRDRHAFWLIGADLSEGRTGSFLAFRVEDIEAFEPSNKAIVAGNRLDEKGFKKEWTKKLAHALPDTAWVDIGSPDRLPARKRTTANDREDGDGLTVASRSPFTTLPGAEGRMLGMIQGLAV